MPASPCSDIGIRPYEAEDRATVRDVCFRTGLMGERVDWQWADAESFADIWVGWYTDNEPESAWVAVCEDRVVGYLVGCRDTRSGPNLPFVFLRSVVTRALPFRPGTAGFMWRAVADLARDRVVPEATPDLDRWPAHLHIDLLPEACGRGVGRALMQTWLGVLRTAATPGVHLGTIAENTRAVAFFEAMGFRRLGRPLPVPGERSPTWGRLHAQTMVQEL